VPTPTTVLPIPVTGKRSVNAFLLLGRRPVVVDAGMPGSAGKIHAGLIRHGVDPSEVALIVLTHGHPDHFGSAARLHQLTGAPVAGHVADLAQYRAGASRRPYRPTGPTGRLIMRSGVLDRPVRPVEPDLLIDGELRLDDYGVAGRIVPTPGHTAGSISVLTDDGDLVAGDLVAGSVLGLLGSRPANPPFHDDPVGNLASLRRMLALDPATLHVGHGGPLDPRRVARWAVGEEKRLSRLAGRGRLTRRRAGVGTDQ